MSPVARADVTGLPAGQLGGARRTQGDSISAILTWLFYIHRVSQNVHIYTSSPVEVRRFAITVSICLYVRLSLCPLAYLNNKFSYRRGTARRTLSVEMLSTAAQRTIIYRILSYLIVSKHEKACSRWMTLKLTQGHRNCRYSMGHA